MPIVSLISLLVGLILAFVAAEAFLIAWLWVQKRRRRSAEESLRQRTMELGQFFNEGTTFFFDLPVSQGVIGTR